VPWFFRTLVSVPVRPSHEAGRLVHVEFPLDSAARQADSFGPTEPFPNPAMPPDQAQWFAAEVQPHEPALRAYLHARFPALGDHDDLVQESFTRVLRAHAAGPVRSAKALLFTTARNAALDLFRRRRAAPLEVVTDFADSCVLEERPGVPELVGRRQELEILAAAVRALPDRCREVMLLRYLDGLPYKEIAARLGISPETVKTQIATGTRRCAEHFAAHGLLAPDAAGEEATA
jgi:RNA polymerase sigma factor (sigma-70 family)